MQLRLCRPSTDGTPGYHYKRLSHSQALTLENKHVRSAMNCGEMVSNNSEPTGTPRSVKSHNSFLAVRSPLLI